MDSIVIFLFFFYAFVEPLFANTFFHPPFSLLCVIAVSYQPLCILFSLYLLPWLLGPPPKLAPPARLPIQALTARDTVPTVDLLASVKIAGIHLLRLDTLDALHVVGFVPNRPSQSFPNLPSRSFPNLPSRNFPNLPGSVEIAVHLFLSLPRDMFDAPDVVVIVLNFVLNLLSVTIAVYHFLLLRRDILDALHVGFFVLFLLFRVPHNVIRAVSRYRLATISSAVWNAERDRGRCWTGVHYWLPGQLLIDGGPSNLAAWTSSVPTVAPFIGMLR